MSVQQLNYVHTNLGLVYSDIFSVFRNENQKFKELYALYKESPRNFLIVIDNIWNLIINNKITRDTFVMLFKKSHLDRTDISYLVEVFYQFLKNDPDKDLSEMFNKISIKN